MSKPLRYRAFAICAFMAARWTLGACLPQPLIAQAVGVYGTVRCPEQGRMDQTRPAANLVVVPVDPQGFGDRADIISEPGYYKLNMSWNDIRQSTLTLRYLGRDSAELSKFIGEELYDRRRKRVLFPTETVPQSCDSIELRSPELARQIRDSVRAQRAGRFPVGRISSGLGIGGSVVSRLFLLAASLGPADTTTDGALATKQQIGVGQFLAYAHSALSQNLGFSVTPFRSLDEVVFSNPSALGAIAPPPLSIQIATGPRFVRGSTIIPLTNRAGLGTGVYWLRQREDRSVSLTSGEIEAKFLVDEIEAIVAGYTGLRSGISVGMSVEFIHQSFTVPIGVQPDSTILKATLRRRAFDLGLSLTAHPTRHVVLGMVLDQVLGTRVRFSEQQLRGLRTLDVGFAYMNGRLNLGVDERFAQTGSSAIGVGLNYVLLNHTVIQLGASSAYRTRTIGLRYLNFFYTAEWSNAFKKLIGEDTTNENVIYDRLTHVIGGRFDI